MDESTKDNSDPQSMGLIIVDVLEFVEIAIAWKTNCDGLKFQNE